MTIEYKQIAQARENSTNPVSLYSPSKDAAGNTETANIFVKFVNVTTAAVSVRVFHDDDGTTYDETTAIAWDIQIDPGTILEMDKIFMNDADGNLAYRSSVANAITATVYTVVKT